MVGDIFGDYQQVQQPYSYPGPGHDPRCEEVRPCVEGVYFHQYWKHFDSALECKEACSGYTMKFKGWADIMTLL